MSRIKLLSELVINQIAAGEVIERPASILKELVENSIDANGTMIRVYLEQGGTFGIKVVDDGIGIHPDDLPLVCAQHATSKITQLDDLYNINSLGFRGEALASIASIAKVVIKSQQNIPTGTTIEVKDLFYNVPVRKKFLKSKITEFNYLQEIFKKITLSHFNIGFMLYNDNKLLKHLPIAINNEDKEKRIIKLLGSKFLSNALFFESQLGTMKLFGWVVSNPQISGVNVQHLYINNRAIRDKLLSSAIKQAMIKMPLQPAYCLYLQLDPILLDVNVHPTKQEVRFSDPRVVYAFVYESILDVVGKRAKHNGISKYLELQEPGIGWQDIIDYHKDPAVINYELSQDNKKAVTESRLFSIFNNKYVIFQKHDTQLLLLDVVYSIKWLIRTKMQQIAKVSSYRLVVPERVKIEYTGDIDLYRDYLELLKFDIHQMHEGVFLVTAVPDCFVLFNITLNYKNFINNLFKCKSTQNINNDLKQITEIILANIKIEQLDLYSKKDLIKLIEQLITENFHFSVINEQEFSAFIKEEMYI